MKRSLVLPKSFQRTLNGLLILLWVTGVIWLACHYGSRLEDLKPLMLKIHGGAAMGILILFGVLLAQHVPAGWKQNDRRLSGGTLVGTLALLSVTGWGLYYLGHETARAAAHWIHSILGFVFPAILAHHVWLARRR